MSTTKRAFILDANSLYARSWHAAHKDPANGVEMVAHIMMRTMVSIYSSKYIFGESTPYSICFWDGASKNDKARAPKPEGYYAGMRLVSNHIKSLLGVPQVCLKYEGEDQVASCAYKCTASKEFEQVIVASGDKDLKQMAGVDGIRYYCFNKKDLLNEEVICSKFGVKHPSQIGFALAITGDCGDNIQGVKGWGQAKVKKLFEHLKSDSDPACVLEHLCSKMNAQQREDFIAAADLTVLHRDIDVPLPEPVLIAKSSEFVEAGFSQLSGYVDMTAPFNPEDFE